MSGSPPSCRGGGGHSSGSLDIMASPLPPGHPVTCGRLPRAWALEAERGRDQQDSGEDECSDAAVPWTAPRCAHRADPPNSAIGVLAKIRRSSQRLRCSTY